MAPNATDRSGGIVEAAPAGSPLVSSARVDQPKEPPTEPPGRKHEIEQPTPSPEIDQPKQPPYITEPKPDRVEPMKQPPQIHPPGPGEPEPGREGEGEGE
ncbi:MAG TPA: hypothetical protein VKZ58_06085 [Longimicrobiales bacterium]|nr:hypothetical protein [Longimicrobiales bacterium]